MDIFGDHWIDHPAKIETAWRKSIGEEDIVLVPGDISWGTKPPDTVPDLEWLAALPGTKVLLKGNHDSWWPKTRSKLLRILPDGLIPVHKNAVRIDPFVFFGTRGSDLVPVFGATPEEIEKRVHRELSHLEASIESLEAERRENPGLIPIALFHYPPFPLGEDASPFTDRLEKAGARICVYGHLHDREEFAVTVQGNRRGIEYRLVSADSLDFTPLRLDL